MIKRYSIGSKEIHKRGGMFGEESYTICDISVEEHPEGGWVKWEDLKEMIGTLDYYENIMMERGEQ